MNRGVEIAEGEKKLSALLYADDIVLLAENKRDLQRMLDVVAGYAKKWRFELNPKKSQVVVFGMRQPPRPVKWWLGESEIEQVGQIQIFRNRTHQNFALECISQTNTGQSTAKYDANPGHGCEWWIHEHSACEHHLDEPGTFYNRIWM